MHRSIIVSSTFRDMHLERDAIHTRVIPTLNAEAAKFGDSVSACDLRWGIDTAGMESVESSKKVLNVCLGEIDRCRPYMIVLLGYRYGWIPSEDLIAQTIKEKEDFSLDSKDISVTALEIEYGALYRIEDIDHTLFYFREIDGSYSGIYQAEDELHREKLSALKSRIQAVPGAHIRTYHIDLEKHEESMHAFSVMVARDLYALMKKEWEIDNALDAYAIDQKRQWEFLEEKNAQFLSRQELLHKCNDVLVQKKQNIL